MEIIDKDSGNRRVRITSYRLPRLDEGETVLLSKKDAIESFDVFPKNVLQGASIYKGRLYMPVGFQKELGERLDSERAIIVISLKRKQIEK